MAERALHILAVHSSADLYGSDRSLLDFVRHRGAGVEMTVVLPERGVLAAQLERAGALVVTGEVCKIERAMRTPAGLLRTAGAALRSIRFLRGVARTRAVDVVYTNTVAALGGALYARIAGVPHVWHVREILGESPALTALFRRLVPALARSVVCNSRQTLEWIRRPGPAATGAVPYRVIWNGVDPPPVESVDRTAERAALGAAAGDVLFVLVGRINAWKGQALLVEALSRLAETGAAAARVAIVGSAYAGQERFERELGDAIAQAPCAARIRVAPFRADIGPVMVAADVVVVPSTKPEPFGRVAIEAMGLCRPVIAAAHGGLTEIVADGETGMLVRPGDAAALAAAMATLLHDAPLRARMGAAGQARQARLFSSSRYAAELAAALRDAAGPRRS